mmetsp:Transcript_7365/g.13682  ORF Transcript_7365/g.13682 Transcript_7365/m.13682 type:complete len:260 (-) Transcript_7365:1103-1882(-)
MLLQKLSSFVARVRAPVIRKTGLIDETGARPTLYPEQDNVERIVLQRGLGSGKELSPVELAAFLYDFANSPTKKVDDPSWLVQLGLQSEAALTHEELEVRSNHIQQTFNTLLQLLKNHEAKTVPGATAAYAVYGAAKLGLDIVPHFHSLFWPVIKLKAKYLSSDELAWLAWGLNSLNINDAEVWTTILPLLKGRQFAADFTQVKKAWLEQNEHIADHEVRGIDSEKLLNETLSALNPSSKEVAALAEEVLAHLKSKKLS